MTFANHYNTDGLSVINKYTYSCIVCWDTPFPTDTLLTHDVVYDLCPNNDSIWNTVSFTMQLFIPKIGPLNVLKEADRCTHCAYIQTIM